MPRRFTVEWTLSAGQDLRSLVGYLIHESEESAEKIFKRIRQKADSLTIFPCRGRVVPELLSLYLSRYREIILSPYRLIYRIEGQKLFVVGLFDGRRDLEEVLMDRLLYEEELQNPFP